MLADTAQPTEPTPIDTVDIHEIRVELARRNLIDFCRHMGPQGFIWGASQVAICAHIQDCIEGKFTRAQVNMPPRAGKSMISSVLTPAWYVGGNPTDKVIMLTGNLLLTSGFMEQLIAMLQSDEYREIFPHFELIDASVNRINYRDRRNPRGERGRLTCMSVQRAAQGVGANLLLADDLISEQEATSKLIKDKIWERWQSGLITRLDPIKNRVVCVATRWARDDPLGRMIAQAFEDENSEPYRVLKIPVTVDKRMADRINKIAMADPIFKADLKMRRVKLLRDGGTFAPERFTMDFVAKQKANLTPEQYAALYLQNPAPESGLIFTKSMFKPLGADMMAELKESVSYSIISVDLAFKADERSDYSAFLHVGVVTHVVRRGGEDFVQNTLVLLDALQDRVEPTNMAKTIRKQYRAWKPKTILVEDAASGTMVIQQLRRANFPIVGFNPRKLPRGKNAKEERANLAAMLISQTPIYYDERSDTIQTALQQILEFPRGDYDDIVDCLVQAVMYLKGRNEFDSSWQTWADEVDQDRMRFDPDDYGAEDTGWQRQGQREWRPEHRRLQTTSPNQAGRIERLRKEHEAANNKRPDPFSAADIRFTDADDDEFDY